MSIARYDLTEDCTTGKVDITPVPETMEGRYVSYEDYAALEQKLAESQREFRAADATIENTQMQLEKMAAENAGLKALARGWANATDDRLFEEHGEIFHDSIEACEEELKTICPATDDFLAEVRASTIETCADDLASQNNIGAHEHNAMYIYAENLRKGVQS